MKHLTIAVLIVTIATSVFAGPIQKAEIPATSTWLMHFDCEKAKTSEMGQLMLKRERAEEEQKKLDGFIEKCGFNPIEDIKSVTLFGDSYDDKDGILYIKGSISTEKLDALLENAKEHKTSSYGSYTIHSWQDKHHNRPAVGCFYNQETILIGQKEDKIKTAIDTLDKTANGLDDQSAIVTVPDVNPGVYLIACAKRHEESLGRHPHAAMLRNAKSLVFALGESDGKIEWEFQLEAKTSEDAALINQIVSGMLSYSILSGNKAPAMADIVKSIQTSLSDQTVSVASSYSSNKMYELIQTWKKPDWKTHHKSK